MQSVLHSPLSKALIKEMGWHEKSALQKVVRLFPFVFYANVEPTRGQFPFPCMQCIIQWLETKGQNYALRNPTFHLQVTYIDVMVLSRRGWGIIQRW